MSEKEHDGDINYLQMELKNQALADSNADLKKQRMSYRITSILLAIAVIIAALIFGILTADIRKESDERITENRRSLFSVNQMIMTERPTYNERLEIFCRKAKGYILDSYATAPPKVKLRDSQINELLLNIYRLSEQFMVDPWIAMAFAKTESDFSAEAVSYAGAKGIFQFMPTTMKMLMGDEYYPECEKNIYHSTRMFFKLYTNLCESFNGDLKWIAASYVAGDYYTTRFYKQGKTFEEYNTWFKIVCEGYVDHSNYQYKIIEY